MAQIQQAQFQAPQKGSGLGKLASLAAIGGGAYSLAAGGAGGAALTGAEKLSAIGGIAGGASGLASQGGGQAPIQSNSVGDQQGAIQRRIEQYAQAPQNQIAEGLQAARALPAQRRQQVEETLRKAYEASQVPQMA